MVQLLRRLHQLVLKAAGVQVLSVWPVLLSLARFGTSPLRKPGQPSHIAHIAHVAQVAHIACTHPRSSLERPFNSLIASLAGADTVVVVCVSSLWRRDGAVRTHSTLATS